MPPMSKIDLETARSIAREKGLKPGRVISSDGVQFTRGSDSRIEILDWEEFEGILESRELAIFESGGFMKIMKRREERSGK